MAAVPHLDIGAPHIYPDSRRIGSLSDGTLGGPAAAVLERARARATGLAYAGNVTPDEALELMVTGAGRFVPTRPAGRAESGTLGTVHGNQQKRDRLVSGFALLLAGGLDRRCHRTAR